MNVLYKYYSSNFDLKKHLESPSMKLSTTKSFNDPFEKNIPHDLATMLTEKLKSELPPDLKRYQDEEYISTYTEVSKSFGVTALTETHRNILMWAHYASSHRGLCIGYKSDFFDRLNKLPKEYSSNTPIYMPKRVIYDYKRFDSEQHDSSHTTYDLIMRAMMTKSDEWIYEKEHRCIIPFSWADKFIKTEDVSFSTEQIIEGFLSDDKIDGPFIDEDTGVIEYKFNGFEYDARDLASCDGISIFKNIEIESIDSIYLGCEYQGMANIIKLITSEQRYKHIKLYRYTMDKNNFSLDLIPLALRRSFPKFGNT
ncbi:DUF2971 domain-containing protein [Aeromonas dhakensis]|uniref:DUF2971 domain-containing protein n=1 Tax=Aeromonas dhakensis TaxID=196024 RepID=UPI00191E4603|nr:DUF2971 domain-containing protein [Aeromonas dhakensis]MBL0657493.1 DUF2971 domain-containing protein [Aeromonas dhakensis]